MPNVHTPERQPNETQQEYRKRMAKSRAIAKAMPTATWTRDKKVSTKSMRRYYPSGQHPKFKAERKRRQHHHPCRDENGAFTWVGRPRRQWLAGVSAQRGY